MLSHAVDPALFYSCTSQHFLWYGRSLIGACSRRPWLAPKPPKPRRAWQAKVQRTFAKGKGDVEAPSRSAIVMDAAPAPIAMIGLHPRRAKADTIAVAGDGCRMYFVNSWALCWLNEAQSLTCIIYYCCLIVYHYYILLLDLFKITSYYCFVITLLCIIRSFIITYYYNLQFVITLLLHHYYILHHFYYLLLHHDFLLLHCYYIITYLLRHHYYALLHHYCVIITSLLLLRHYYVIITDSDTAQALSCQCSSTCRPCWADPGNATPHSDWQAYRPGANRIFPSNWLDFFLVNFKAIFEGLRLRV